MTRRTDLVPLLRCVCVLLVLASQLWILHPITDADRASPLDGVLRSGNLAYAGLFACSGFAFTLVVLPLVGERRRTALVGGERLLLRVVPVMALVCVSVAVVSAVDSTDTTPGEVTRTSMAHVLSFHWNDYVRDHPLGVRTDLVPLWFFSVEVQLLLGVLLLLLLLGRRRRLLVGVLVVAIVASYVWSLQVFADRGWFVTGLRTDTHVDAVLCGVLAAVLAQRPRWSPAAASTVVGAGALGLLGLVLFASRMTLEQSFQGVASLTALTIAVMLGAAATGDGRGKVFDLARGAPALTDLGRTWAYVLAFGAPVFATLSRHTATWDSVSRVLAAVAVLAVIAYVVDKVIRPMALAASAAIATARAGGRANETSAAEVTDVDGGARRQ